MILWKLPGEEKRKRGRIILQSQWGKGLSVIQNLESIKEIINNKKTPLHGKKQHTEHQSINDKLGKTCISHIITDFHKL